MFLIIRNIRYLIFKKYSHLFSFLSHGGIIKKLYLNSLALAINLKHFNFIGQFLPEHIVISIILFNFFVI